MIKRLIVAAGFLVGEGSFLLRRRGTIAIYATQAEREPLDRLQRMFGGRVIKIPRPDRPNVKQIWQWYMVKGAAGVLMTLYPLMRTWSPKRVGEVLRCLAAWKTSLGRGHAQLVRRECPQGHPYSAGNTYVSRKGHRHCRACGTTQRRRSDARHRRQLRAASRDPRQSDLI